MEPELDITRLVVDFMSKSYNTSKFQDMLNNKKTRVILSIDKLRDYSEDLCRLLIYSPLKF